MRYLCIALLIAGCATAPKGEGGGAPVRSQAAPTASELSEMLRVGAYRLERDTVLNGWLIRDTSGVVVVTGISVITAGEEGAGLPAGYGDCIAK